MTARRNKMTWIADALSVRSSEILKVADGLIQDAGTVSVPAEEIMKQAELTLELLIEALSTRESAPLFDCWEMIGKNCSERDLPISDIPQTTEILKRAIWIAMQDQVERSVVKFADLVDAMMVVESVLSDCWFTMVHSYLGSRDIRVTAKAERMEALYALTEVLSMERDDARMYKAIVDKVASITRLPRCSLLLFDEDGSLRPVVSNYRDAVERLGESTEKELSALSAVASLGGPVILEKGHNPFEIETVLANYDTPIVLLAPLRTAEKDLGILLLDSGKDGEFNQEQIDLAIASANQAAIAIEKSGLVKEMEIRLKHMAAIGIVARSLTTMLEPEDQIKNLLDMGCALVRADSGVLLTQEESFGDIHEQVSSGRVEWARGDSFYSIARWVNEHKEPVVWQKGVKDPRFVGVTLQTEAGIIAPMLVREKVIGVLGVGSERQGEKYDSDDVEMFKNFSAQAAVAVENTRLYDRLQDTYLGAIGALAAAIEARDPYTVGHSARVTQYAVAIAESMKLSTEETEEIRLAALLHDVGKIGVSDHILNKPGRLNEEEYSAMKMHPELSMRIMTPLPHRGDIIPIIYHHHEHYDGSGYVDGQSGEEIPLGARIVSVADAYEAMTSDRPYRAALSREDAVQELRVNAGTQFDPEVVRHFLNLLEKPAL
jgi:putative nucleotidyltransferase with HDIG domain